MKEALIGNCSVGTFYSPLGNSNELLNCNPWYLKSLGNKKDASFKSIDANMQYIVTAITSEMCKQGNDVRGN
jgi:hypothetical protein